MEGMVETGQRKRQEVVHELHVWAVVIVGTSLHSSWPLSVVVTLEVRLQGWPLTDGPVDASLKGKPSGADVLQDVFHVDACELLELAELLFALRTSCQVVIGVNQEILHWQMQRLDEAVGT